MVKLNRCAASCNTLDDLSNKVYVPNKTEDLSLNIYKMITEINVSKTLTKHISCECKCRFDGRNCNSGQWSNNDRCWCECKKLHVCEKNYVWNPATCNCQNGKYLASTMDDSAITCDGIIESYKDEKNYMKKEQPIKHKISIFYLHFFKITIALLIAVSIYCYLIKYQAKQKHLLPFNFTNNKIKEIIY